MKLPIGVVTVVVGLLLIATPHAAVGANQLGHLHARALDSFRQGRFPEAYGRFIELAELGHPASARYALFMCEHGPALFGKDWDCASHQIEAWANAAGVMPPTIGGRSYGGPHQASVTARQR